MGPDVWLEVWALVVPVLFMNILMSVLSSDGDSLDVYFWPHLD